MPSKTNTAIHAALRELFSGLKLPATTDAKQPKPPKVEKALNASESEGSICNAIAKRFRLTKHEIPTARVTLIGKQTCRCCGNELRYIHGEYIQLDNTTLKSRRLLEIAVPGDLPHNVDELGTIYIDNCPDCLRYDAIVDDIFNGHHATNTCQQLKLF